MKADDYAKVNLESLTIIENYFKPNDLKRVLKITKDHREYFLRKWDEFFKS